MKQSPLKRKTPLKPGNKPLRRTKLSPGTKTLAKRRKSQRGAKSGQLDLFKRLYDEQGGLCAVTGRRLLPPGHARFHCQGSHLLPKGSYPEYKLDPRNVVMITQAKHDEWHANGRDVLYRIDERWAPIVKRYVELRLEANTKNNQQ